jgi:DNA polymerase (family 10)
MEQRLLERLEASEAGREGRWLLATAERVDVAGSYRRRRATVARVVEQGDTRAAVRLDAGLRADLRVVPPASYGAALLYFTSSSRT